MHWQPLGGMNAAKQDSLGVSGELIERHGAVSEPVVAAMLDGTLAHSPSRWWWPQ